MTTSILRSRTALSRSRLVGLSIAALLVFAVLFGAVFTTGAQAAVSYSDQEIAFVNLLNNYRVANGRSPLLVSDAITLACDRHNSDMAKYKFFDHYSLKSDWFAANASPWNRMAASGYTYNTSGASVTVKFTGTYLAWIATAGTTLSKAYVSLDGGAAQSINLTRTAVAYQQRVWNTGTLTSGPHTVKIWWNPSNAAGKYISVDAFEVKGSLN